MKEMMGEINTSLIKYCNEYFNTELTRENNFQELKNIIEQKINYLISNNFQQFIYVLYKVDVAENKLKKVLQENKQTDAATVITNLIIERLQQKIEARKNFKSSNLDISEDEKW